MEIREWHSVSASCMDRQLVGLYLTFTAQDPGINWVTAGKLIIMNNPLAHLCRYKRRKLTLFSKEGCQGPRGQ